MEVEIKTVIPVSIETLAKEMSIGEIAELLSHLAERLNEDFSDRTHVARNFAENTSELGARFLASKIP